VVAVSQTFGLAIMAALVLVDRAPMAWRDFGAGAAAGAIGLIGVILLYRGLAAGTMSLVAPITAVGAAVLPLVWGLITGERPSVIAFVGVVVALAAVALVSTVDAEANRAITRVDLLLALTAGAAFGMVFVLLGTTGEGSGMWPVFGARIASVTLVTLVVLATRRPWKPASGTLVTVATAGVFDAGANALYLLASRAGLLSVVSVLSSLYPAATVVLARAALHERLSRTQVLGIALALTGVVLIAAG
jgi:drug/metabolite transporter (DMT)-like permease